MKQLATVRLGVRRIVFLVALSFVAAALGSSCKNRSAARKASLERSARAPGAHVMVQQNVMDSLPICPPRDSPLASASNLTKSRHRVILSWTASASADSTHADAFGYCVYRGKSPDDPLPVRINSVPFRGISCADEEVQNGRYYYLVKAISALSNLSKSSNVALVTIPPRGRSKPSGKAVPSCRGSASN
jgi:hypothetical protein